jgi:hypothetical protein
MHIKLCIAFSWNKNLAYTCCQEDFCYLKGTKDNRIILKPDERNKIDCHVDSGFAGLFVVEDGLKPICAKSRAGYGIKYCDAPIFWV